jgi:hypothetical protein
MDYERRRILAEGVAKYHFPPRRVQIATYRRWRRWLFAWIGGPVAFDQSAFL